jgi:hypothetical protein
MCGNYKISSQRLEAKIEMAINIHQYDSDAAIGGENRDGHKYSLSDSNTTIGVENCVKAENSSIMIYVHI